MERDAEGRHEEGRKNNDTDDDDEEEAGDGAVTTATDDCNSDEDENLGSRHSCDRGDADHHDDGEDGKHDDDGGGMVMSTVGTTPIIMGEPMLRRFCAGCSTRLYS